MEFHVTREGKTVGKFEEESVKDGLSSGFLRPSDRFFHEGMDDWELLGSRFPIQTSTDESAKEPAKTDIGPIGVRGWLLTFCIYLIANNMIGFLTSYSIERDELMMVLNAVEITEEQLVDYQMNPEEWEPNDLLDIYLGKKFFADFLYPLYMGFEIILAVLIMLKVSKIRIVAIISIVLSFLLLSYYLLLDFGVQSYLTDEAEAFFVSLFTWVIYASISIAWFIYFLRSKRVKNTLT